MNERIEKLLDSIKVNERIESLAEQAGCKIDRLGYGEGNLEKFAMLIIQECIRVPYDMWDRAELNADVAVKIENRIKEQFWMEE